MPRKLIPIITPVLFFAALWVLHRELNRFHYHDIIAYLSLVPSWHILLALILTAINYGLLSFFDVLALRYTRTPLPYRTAAPVSFISYALGHSFGNTLLTGGSIRFRMYASEGLGALDITKVVLFCGSTFWIGYLFMAGLAFTIDPPDILSLLHFHLPFMSLHPIGFLFLSIFLLYLGFALLRRKPWVFRGIELAIPSWRIALIQILLGALDLSLACGTLYALLPHDIALSFISFIGIFLLAILTGIISQVPGGLGVFETVIVVLLGDGVAGSHIMGALLIFRGIYYLLPLLSGALLLGFMEFKHRGEEWRGLARSMTHWIPFVTPQVLSLTTFLGGTILLLSGATPSAHGRLGWLNNFLPLPILEISHFLGSAAGIGLVLLSRGIQRRMDAAYFLTMILLAAGILFSLLKGFDYEEALVLTLMLAALLPCHRQFYRKSSLLSDPFTPGWIASILLVLIATSWIGFFSFKHVSYSNELWWHFSLKGDAPRFLRASAGVMGISLFAAAAILLRPVRHIFKQPSPADLDQTYSIIQTSSRTSANLALLGDKSFLFSESGNSFLMYGVEKRSWVALGNPVGPEEKWEDLIWEFHEMVDRNGGWTVFYQIGSESLHHYLELGLTLLKIGEEAQVPLDSFSLEGSTRKGLRHTHRKLEKEGCVFEIIPPERVAEILPEIKIISDAWIKEKNTHEKKFSLGFFQEEYLKRFPCALIRHEGRIVAFANVLPTKSKEELSVDLMRFSSNAPHDVMEYLFIQLMLWGNQEGYRWFNLGMAPLAGLESRPLAPLWNRVGGMIFRHGEHFYNFEGLRDYKDKFDPIWKPRYLASPGGIALPRIFMDLATLIGGGVKGVLMK